MPKSSLTDQAYELLKNDILTCRIMPGEQIAQAQLVERFGIGLSPVREALQRLAQEGYVQSIPRFGYLISPVTIADVQELFELRQILECAAVRLAVERGTEEDIRKLNNKADFTYVYHNHESYSDFLQRNNEFHRNIATLSGNQRLVDVISRVLGELLRLFHLGLDLRDSAEEMREEHVELVTALLERDGDLAEEIVQKQIIRSQERIIEALVQRARTVKGTTNLQGVSV
jgi:DNA-binding GntR family transcriptional regulator